MSDDQSITVADAARMLGRSNEFVRQLIHSGDVDAAYDGKSWRIHVTSLVLWVDGTKFQRARGRGDVYFVRYQQHIKIGVSSNWRVRVASLKSQSPVPLETVLVISGGQGVEQWLHWRFAPYRAHGEWFVLPYGWQKVVSQLVEEERLIVMSGPLPRFGETATCAATSRGAA